MTAVSPGEKLTCDLVPLHRTAHSEWFHNSLNFVDFEYMYSNGSIVLRRVIGVKIVAWTGLQRQVLIDLESPARHKIMHLDKTMDYFVK